MDWALAKDLWWILGAAAGALGLAARAGWKSRRLLARLDRLERHDDQRREDIAMLLEGMFAVLDGLKQQGVRGEVACAAAKLQQYVVARKR